MEMDAVPIKHHWLEQFEMEAAGMTPGSLAVRGRQYMVDEWDLLEHMMPEYSMEHINGNAVYNLEPNWTKYLRETFMSDANNDMMEKMAFDVEFAMIAIDAMNENYMFYAGSMAAMGDNMTYNWHSMQMGSYANTLPNITFGFPTYIRHGSSKNLFENLEDDEVTWGVAFYDMRGHLKEAVPTTHPFNKIWDLAYFDQATMTEEIVAPDGHVTLKTMKAMRGPTYHLCETAKSVETKRFALTGDYHIVKAPESVLMVDDDVPVGQCMRGYSSPKDFYINKIVEGVATFAAMSDFKYYKYKSFAGCRTLRCGTQAWPHPAFIHDCALKYCQ